MQGAMTQEEGFRQAEASCLLEGVDPNRSAHYVAMKARVIAGEIDIDEAIQQTVDHYKSIAASRVMGYSVAE
jgi:hypothetical protein